MKIVQIQSREESHHWSLTRSLQRIRGAWFTKRGPESNAILFIHEIKNYLKIVATMYSPDLKNSVLTIIALVQSLEVEVDGEKKKIGYQRTS